MSSATEFTAGTAVLEGRTTPPELLHVGAIQTAEKASSFRTIMSPRRFK